MFLLAFVSSAVITSAALLFLVQPLFARMALPLLGGSPQVWITCMVFFQLTLLAGYAYAHALSTRFRLERQALIHALVLALPLALLPLSIDPASVPAGDARLQWWLLGTLATTVGLPFFAVSTTGPLLQRWFSHSDHADASDPYFLYAASNAGSLVGLLSYPLLLEPWLTVAGQNRFWAWGYGMFALLSAGSALMIVRRRAPEQGGHGGPKPVPVRPARALRWVFLAFVPSSLMLGLTTHITTEIAVAPLLWVVPLALYLLTFILAFGRRSRLRRNVLLKVFPALAIVLVLMLISGSNEPVALAMAVHIGFFFVAALLCHGELARDRPETGGLTLFYLMLAVGGALGGVFNGLVSPWLFDSVAEYPLTIVLACLACPPRQPERVGPPSWRDAVPALAVAAAVGGLWLAAPALTAVVGMEGHRFDALRTGLVVGLPLIACYLLVNQPRRFALALGAVCLTGFAVYEETRGDLLFAERSFFGVHRVSLHPGHQARVLRHGFTAHGMQKTEPALRRTGTTYYHPSGPAGQVFSAFGERISTVGLVGLGAGTLATLANPDDVFVFYEIDPVVARIAEDQRLFTFLSDARSAGAEVEVRLGDARLQLQRAPDRSYDLLVLDAFTNDSIPVHLMTREALALYMRKLGPEGLLLIHVSNRHLPVHRPLADLAADAGLFALYQDDPIASERQLSEGKFRSQWVLMARERSQLNPLGPAARRWRILEPPGGRVWTDDYSNIMQLILAGSER